MTVNWSLQGKSGCLPFKTGQFMLNKYILLWWFSFTKYFKSKEMIDKKSMEMEKEGSY